MEKIKFTLTYHNATKDTVDAVIWMSSWLKDSDNCDDTIERIIYQPEEKLVHAWYYADKYLYAMFKRDLKDLYHCDSKLSVNEGWND